MSMNDVYAEIRSWLADRIKAKAISQAELARSMNLPPSAVSRILKGERQISISELIDAAAILGASMQGIDDLLYGIKKKNSLASWNKKIPEEEITIPELYLGDNARYPEEQSAQIGSYSDKVAEWRIPKFALDERRSDAVLTKWYIVPDDSMTPTLAKGDTVFLNFGIVNPLRNGIYAIEEPEANLLIRRLEFYLEEGQLRAKVICDNPSFQDSEAFLSEVRIVAICVAQFSIIRE